MLISAFIVNPANSAPFGSTGTAIEPPPARVLSDRRNTTDHDFLPLHTTYNKTHLGPTTTLPQLAVTSVLTSAGIAGLSGTAIFHACRGNYGAAALACVAMVPQAGDMGILYYYYHHPIYNVSIIHHRDAIVNEGLRGLTFYGSVFSGHALVRQLAPDSAFTHWKMIYISPFIAAGTAFACVIANANDPILAKVGIGAVGVTYAATILMGAGRFLYLGCQNKLNPLDYYGAGVVGRLAGAGATAMVAYTYNFHNGSVNPINFAFGENIFSWLAYFAPIAYVVYKAKAAINGDPNEAIALNGGENA